MAHLVDRLSAPDHPVVRGRKIFPGLCPCMVLRTVDPYEELVMDPRACPREKTRVGGSPVWVRVTVFLLLALCLVGLAWLASIPQLLSGWAG